MNINEVAEMLGWRPEDVKACIEKGVTLPFSKSTVYLEANKINDIYEVDDDQLEVLISCFEQEEPGRHPPVKVLRELLVETNHQCAICRNSAPLQFHHIIEYSRLHHHDPKHMMALCGTCHSKCTVGQISISEQRDYKDRLNRNQMIPFLTASSSNGPIRFNWFDLEEIIKVLQVTLNGLEVEPSLIQSKYDFKDIDLSRKNELNHLGEDYFVMMEQEHEQYFGIIDGFLKNPANRQTTEIYYEIVEELRSKVAASQSRFTSFENLLIEFADAAVQNLNEALPQKRRILNILLSYMYFCCDIGRKS